MFCLAGGSLAGRPIRGRLLGRSRGGSGSSAAVTGSSLSAAVNGSSRAAVTGSSLSRRSGLNHSRTHRRLDALIAMMTVGDLRRAGIDVDITFNEED